MLDFKTSKTLEATFSISYDNFHMIYSLYRFPQH